MRNYTIYLAGQISKDTITYKWRRTIIEELKYYKNLIIINPCNSKFNQTIKNNSDLFATWPAIPISNLLLPKDKNHVLNSDCVIANLNIYSKDKPLIGTLFELAWAYDQPQTMVIGIYNENFGDKYIIEHPFVRQCLNIIVSDEYEACKVVRSVID